MRIISGIHKGKQLYSPLGNETRPTADRARQTLFDILMHAPWAGREYIESAVILDGFAGTGAVGLEALSRGAKYTFFCEKNLQTRIILQKNIQQCHMVEQSHIYKDIFHLPPISDPCNLIFLDPPYHQNLIPSAIQYLQNQRWISSHSLIITETANDENLDLQPSFTIVMERKIGAACFKVWINNHS